MCGLRFGHKNESDADLKSTSLIGKKNNRRLLLLIFTLGLVLILIFEARDASHWQWIEHDAAVTDLAPSRQPSAEPGATDSSMMPGLNRDLLDAVRDDRRFGEDEQEAWFHLLGLLKNSTEERLRQLSIGRVTRISLAEQPKEYRGELVGMIGIVRRALAVPAAENKLGLEQLYQLWVQPDDDRSRPVVVFAVGLPERFPLGQDLDEPIDFVGFSFKRWAHQSQAGWVTSPVVLSKTVRWVPRVRGQLADGGDGVSSEPWLVFSLAVALAVAVLMAIWRQTRRRPPREKGKELRWEE
jgi:hypothetical protein